MTLVDKEIRSLIDEGVLVNADAQNVGSISCDLSTASFAQKENDALTSFTLNPGESVFVACNEMVRLPNDLCARIVLRNSRIREGLNLTAPVYQPGHETRLFFRLTNVSEKVIQLKEGAKYASVMFEKLSEAPETPYKGTFQQELSFVNMGDYHKEYKLELSEVEEKAEDLKKMEKNIYANVITLMTVFIGLFSLINVNIEFAYADKVELARMLVYNLVTVGSIAFLVFLIRMTTAKISKKEFWILLGFTVIALCVAVVIAIV